MECPPSAWVELLNKGKYLQLNQSLFLKRNFLYYFLFNWSQIRTSRFIPFIFNWIKTFSFVVIINDSMFGGQEKPAAQVHRKLFSLHKRDKNISDNVLG